MRIIARAERRASRLALRAMCLFRSLDAGVRNIDGRVATNLLDVHNYAVKCVTVATISR
jgi:hypothetical protein